MTLERIMKARQNCLNWNYKRKKKLSFKDLDILIYVVDEYVRIMEHSIIDNDG